MTAWLKSIEAALKCTAEIDGMEPDEEGCSHDHLMGILTEDLRRSYYLIIAHYKHAEKAATAARVHTCSDRDGWLADAEWHNIQAKALTAVFWASCLYAFPELRGKENIGLRKGWKIVWCDHPTAPEQLSLITMILGEGGSDDTLETLFGADDDEDIDPRATTRVYRGRRRTTH